MNENEDVICVEIDGNTLNKQFLETFLGKATSGTEGIHIEEIQDDFGLRKFEVCGDEDNLRSLRIIIGNAIGFLRRAKQDIDDAL